MRHRVLLGFVLLGLAVGLLPAGCGPTGADAPGPETARLVARLAALVPAVDAALGDPPGPPPAVRVVPRGRSARLALDDALPAGLDYLEDLVVRREEKHRRNWPCFVAPDGALLIVDAPGDSGEVPDEVLSQALAASRLARRHDLGTYMAGAGTIEGCCCRYLALLSLARALASPGAGHLEAPAGRAPATGWLGERVRAAFASDLALERRAEGFARFLLDRFGPAEAARRLFAAPPRTARDLLEPERWLAAPESAPAGYEAAERVRQVLAEAGGDPWPVLPHLPESLPDIPGGSRASVVAAHSIHGLSGEVLLVLAADEASAGAVVEALATRAREVDATSGSTAVEAGVAVSGAAGLRFTRTPGEASPAVVEQVLVRSGPWVLEVCLEYFECVEWSDHDAESLARAALAALAEPPPGRPDARGLCSPDGRVRWLAARSLAGRRGLYFRVRDALAGLLADPDPLVRVAAARALAGSPPAPAALAAAAAGDPDWQVRWISARAAGRVREALADRDERVRARAVRHLAAERRAGRIPSLPAALVAPLLADPAPRVRAAAFEALTDVDGMKVLADAVFAGIRDPDPAVRAAAAFHLYGLQRDARCPEALLALLGDPVRVVREATAFPISGLDSPPPALREALGAALAESDLVLRREAVDALGRMGEAAWPEVPRIRALAEDPYPGVRASAARALGEVAFDTPVVRQVLQGLVGDTVEEVRDAAEAALVALDHRRSARAAPGGPEPLPGQSGRIDSWPEHGDPRRLEALFRAARDQGADALATRIAQHVVERVDPNSAWANEALGRRDLRGIWARIPSDEILSSIGGEAYETLRMESETSESWYGSPEEYDRAEALLARVIAERERLLTDRRFGALRRYIAMTRPDDGPRVAWESWPWVVWVRPFSPGSVESVAVALGPLLDLPVREFLERVAVPLRWPALDEPGREEDGCLSAFVLEEEDLSLFGPDGPPWLTGRGAGCIVSSREVILVTRPRPAERLVCESGLPGHIFRVLLDRYRHLLRGAEAGRAAWLTEGLAEVFGAWEPRPEGGIRLLPVNALCLAGCLASRAAGTTPPLADVLGAPAEALTEGSPLLAEAWALCHFLWFADDGRHRPALLAALDREVREGLRPEDGEGVLGRPVDAALAAALEAHLRSLR